MPALLSLFKFMDDYVLLEELSSIGPACRFHVATKTGYGRVVQDGVNLPLVTWLHDLDLSDAQRFEASMRAAKIREAIDQAE